MEKERKLNEYDHELMDSLVGKNIHYYHNDWKVIAHVHNHLYLLREKDGFDKMDRCAYIEDELKKQAKNNKLKESNAFQKIFNERGCFIGHFVMSSNGDGYDVLVGGKIGSFVSYGGVSIDYRRMIIGNNTVDGLMEFGGESAGFGMAHTFEEDPTKPCGYKMIDGSEEILLDEQKWMTWDEMKLHGQELFEKELEKQTGFKDNDEISVAYGTAKDADFSFTFFKLGDDTGYRYRGPYKLKWGGTIHYIDVGKNKGKHFQSGRSARWGGKWSIPKKVEPILWKDLREKLFEYQKVALDEAFSLTTEQKIAKSMDKDKKDGQK